MTAATPNPATTPHTPQRPDECPDVAGHARPRPLSDHRPERRLRCPSCGFFCLLAPACEPCRRGVGSTAPGPAHVPSTPGHGAHCSCDGCY